MSSDHPVDALPCAACGGEDETASELQRAIAELVRVYQFRDRHRVCYYDISVTQCHALSTLTRRGPVNLKDIAAELYLDKSTTSRVVDTLDAKGYVRRSADPGDGRAVRVEITATGRALHDRIERDLVAEMRELLSDFEPALHRSMADVIRRITNVAVRRFGGDGSADR